MESLVKIVDFLFSISTWSIAKGVFLFALLIYLVFTLIVVRQVSNMTQFIISPMNFLIQAFSWMLFVLAAGVFLGVLIFV